MVDDLAGPRSPPSGRPPAPEAEVEVVAMWRPSDSSKRRLRTTHGDSARQEAVDGVHLAAAARPPDRRPGRERASRRRRPPRSGRPPTPPVTTALPPRHARARPSRPRNRRRPRPGSASACSDLRAEAGIGDLGVLVHEHQRLEIVVAPRPGRESGCSCGRSSPRPGSAKSCESGSMCARERRAPRTARRSLARSSRTRKRSSRDAISATLATCPRRCLAGPPAPRGFARRERVLARW